ncbi:MAG TPA: CPBP family intramembrane metalloprotease [Ferruginibacter sp.]|nr:CPBP family intramembrane metalloprotease [Ferruginibacter sp.]HRO17004.1 CPBP family intramembrane metalloprotease [Ferruginibacter sp.]HRQ20437.1 CPBP family intramembrane metalloprotease [Ferruginibacter sp.]
MPSIFMDILWLVFFIAWPVIAGFMGIKRGSTSRVNLYRVYGNELLMVLGVLSMVYVLRPSLYQPISQLPLHPGFVIKEDIFWGIVSVFLTPFFLAFTRFTTHYPKDIQRADALFGFPVRYLPEDWKTYGLFAVYIIAGVVFEELVCRLFMFRLLHAVWGVNGDIMVVCTAFVFAIGHLYQGWKGVISNFITGLLFGKVFLMKQDIVYPLVLHLSLNATILVLAARRIRDLRRH